MAIIDMSSVKNKKQPTREVTTSDEALQEKLKLLQQKGFEEIEQYRQLVNNFIAETSKLAITNRIMDDFMGEQIRFFLNSEVLDALIKPIFEGERLPFIPEKEYLEIREDIYRDLAAKYLDGDDLNKPF